ncbi:ATP-binding protein [Draconibacterium sp. IB214405]|uniref:hybrid sensor histidine kinase/response regulator transcription factor n=1 Tax=Draconibacterium sp. IB214405 TaxID=3097352 RepID=UPI002A15FE8A|nr:ATP-binding protein [Draconibacterium sp. IB214405]MDX8337888.1 ATP-binding protein [Draconibacterium sp. IB214405]
MLPLNQLSERFELFLHRLTEDETLSDWDKLGKKYMMVQGIFAITGLSIMLIVSRIISARLIFEFCLMYIPIVCVSTTIFYYARKMDVAIKLFKILMIVISSVYVARMGGLLTCGGLFLLSIQAVTSSVILRKPKLILPVSIVFVVAMLSLFVMDPYFPKEQGLNPQQNLLFFFVSLIIITGYIFFFSLYAVNLFAKMEEREAQRQKEMNEAKTRLYTNITHEFRTPLTVILGLADSLRSVKEKNCSAKADTIIKNGKNLLQLVDQLLELSKMESGNLSVKKIHANIVPFLRYVFQLQEYYAGEKNLKMIFEADKESYVLDFDPEKTTVIVSNLLSNAIKFTPAGGSVKMHVLVENEMLSVIVSDTGIGIPPEKQNKIFDRFFQADNKNTRKVGGAGIGLALTRELVTLLNGTIQVNSVPNKLTVFTVKLPVTRAIHAKEFQQREQVFAEPQEKSLEDNYSATDLTTEKDRLLIVEDNPDVLVYLQACYSDYFRIQLATDGKEGFEKAVNEIPDVIISDVMMPEMDGFELCKKLKEDFRTSHIPIVLLTAKADIPSRIEGLEQGADAYVVKPFNQQELLVRLQKLLELRKKLYQRFSKGNDFDYSTDPIMQREDRFMKKLNSAISENLNNEYFNVPELCEEMAMSKSQLYRKFKALTNQSVARYIRSLRMQKAKQLLSTSSMNITEVGYEVGMKSLSTFSQVFKEEFGESPREFLLHENERSYN